MNINDYFVSIRNKFNSLLNEAKGHLDHPEDLVVLNGIDGAKSAVNSIVKTAKNPKQITIKWDGYPALIFGRDLKGRFSIMDKHMFNKKDMSGRKIYSPDDFIAYDKARGVDRSQLHNLLRQIWPSLEKETKSANGYYWGDLLFHDELKDMDGYYKFRANPNGITYAVKSDSDIGKLLKNKKAGIAVHQYLAPDSENTDQATSLGGNIGQLKNNSDVAILPSAMPYAPDLNLKKDLISKTNSAITKYGPVVEKLFDTAPQARNSFNQLFTTYINSKIVSGNLNDMANDFMSYVESRPMSANMKKKIADHLNSNKNGVLGVFAIWIALYNLKMDLVKQLADSTKNSPVQGYLQSGQQSQEGYVSQGLKFVDRLGFSRQNLAAKR